MKSLVFQLTNGTISGEDFEHLQDRLEADPAAREDYLAIVGLIDALSEISLKEESMSDVVDRDRTADEPSSVALTDSSVRDASILSSRSWSTQRLRLPQVSIAATVLIAVGLIAFWLGRRENLQPMTQTINASSPTQQTEIPAEPRVSGHATLRRTVDLVWDSDAKRFFEGDVLPNGSLRLLSGLAEIDFFCGATLIVEGPAELDIESDWSVRVGRGRLRANVPPAARGFIVKAADAEIIDLGTEFAVDVDAGNALVQVIDGEVQLKGGNHDGRHLFGGEVASLLGKSIDNSVFEGLSTVSDLSQQRLEAQQKRLDAWRVDSARFRLDRRLVAHYPMVEGSHERVIPNTARTGGRFDGQLVGPVQFAEGRFGTSSTGLNFSRLGARVRTRIDGEFNAFTFACWVKLDSLDQRYNALFMGDGFDNGEPHWQIRDDGRLMITVMVDDTQKFEHFSELERRMVVDAGLHRNYLSKPFWDLSKSGQWIHLAVVYDPAGRRVMQYADGDVICNETIEEQLVPATLRIGPAEIGNWGQPFRKTPEFAIRNLNGTIDELAIFDAALTREEIRAIYESGKPLGY